MPPRTAYVQQVKTHRYAADAYEKAWQDKVERVGNLNYPEEARRKNLSGGLLLAVGVNADGSLHGINVATSSGHAELDEAAARIVRLAAPFAPFPSQLKADYDVLVITRTWRFFTDHHLSTAP
jgi:protein TonB